jgi:redox-sensitive bicupin YhaK (pirin superfamily)
MLELVIDQRRRDIGGFEVGRILPFAQRRMVGPFIFLDHLGPIEFAAGLPRSVDVRPHPHIGLATVTYLFAGEIMHRDSVGSEQAIRPGEVNWMIAGHGITHSERFEAARAHGGPMHGVQSWVALPREDEETEPGFAHHGREALPTLEEAGVTARLIAGSVAGVSSPVRTHSPLFYMHWSLRPGASAHLPNEYGERAAYVAAGTVQCSGRSFSPGQMLVFGRGDATVTAQSAAVVMALGGEPIGERFIEWNFVASSQARIEQAKADWRAGRMKLPDADSAEFIPLPPEPPPAPTPPL